MTNEECVNSLYLSDPDKRDYVELIDRVLRKILQHGRGPLDIAIDGKVLKKIRVPSLSQYDISGDTVINVTGNQAGSYDASVRGQDGKVHDLDIYEIVNLVDKGVII